MAFSAWMQRSERVLVVPLLQLLQESPRRSLGCRGCSPCPSASRPARGPDPHRPAPPRAAVFRGYRARLPAEGVEAGPGDVRALKELLGHLQRRPDVPGDEVYIAAEKAGGSAGQGEHLGAVPGGEHFLQLVPEGEDLLRSFLLPQGVQRDSRRSPPPRRRHGASSMKSLSAFR